jgi:hypothetical protein
LRTAAGLPVERGDLDPPNLPRERMQFAERYRIDRAGTAQRTILQALSLMNGPLTTAFTSVETSPTLAAVADAPFLSTAGKIESLFLAALGRKPTELELAPLAAHVEARAIGGSRAPGLADVFWALVNSSEFGTNH